jgi:hypothetical protein
MFALDINEMFPGDGGQLPLRTIPVEGRSPEEFAIDALTFSSTIFVEKRFFGLRFLSFVFFLSNFKRVA